MKNIKGELPETDGEKDYTPITPAKLLKEMEKTSTPIPMNSQEEENRSTADKWRGNRIKKIGTEREKNSRSVPIP